MCKLATSPRLLALLAAGFLQLGLAQQTHAWTLYNETNQEIEFEVYDEDYDLVEKGKLGPKGTDKTPDDIYGCGWEKKTCNKTEKRDSELTVILRRDENSWACSLTMLGGGYALVYQVDNSNLKSVYWCYSEFWEGKASKPLDINGDGDKSDYVGIDWSDSYLHDHWIKDGPGNFTPDTRNVRFLITGDPQINNSGVSDDCHWRNWCTPDAGTGEEFAYDTFIKMTDLLRSDRYGYKRWNSDYRGIIVSGDLTQETRWDEFKLYAQMSTGGNVFTNNDLYPKKHPAMDLIPLQERLYEGIGNHDLGVSNNNVLCQADLDARYGYQDCRKKIEEYVAEHNRGAKQESTRDDTPHYSWEWHDIHFVQINLFPGDTPSADHPDHDPQYALDFLKEDLQNKVGADSKRPVVLIHHYGFDDFSQRDWFDCDDETDGDNSDGKGRPWWTDAERIAYWNAIKDYNVIAIFTGHNHLRASDQLTTYYGVTAGGETCVTDQGWRSDFKKPAGSLERWDSATEIPAFNAAATRNGTTGADGMYLDVEINHCNEMIVNRSDGDSDSITFYSPGDISLACDPNADCRDAGGIADNECKADLSIAGPAAFGICSQEPPGPYIAATPVAIGEPVTLNCVNLDGTLIDSCSALVWVRDYSGPNVTCPDIGTTPIECGDPILWEPEGILDNCDLRSDLTVDCAPVAGTIAKLGMDGLRGGCNVTDTSGNTGSCRTADRAQVVDTLKPVVTLNGSDIEIAECGSGPFQDPYGSATDQCDDNLSLTRTPGVVGTQALGQKVLTYEATDDSGNVGTAQRTLEVVDTLPPVIHLNGRLTDTAECGAGPYDDPYGSAIDQCDDTLSLTRTPAAVSTATTGDKTLTYEARDSSGNLASAERILSVVDTTPPQVLLYGPQHPTTECRLGATWTDPGAVAGDVCWGPQSVETIGGVALDRVGEYKVTYQAVDGSQLVGQAERWVTVADTRPPVVSLLGAPQIVLECGVDTYTEAGANANDECSGNLAIQQSGSVDTSTVGPYQLLYEAQDGVGLSASATRDVLVDDTLAPSMVCEDVVAEPTGPDGAAVSFGATATDLCDTAPVVSCPLSGQIFAVGTETGVDCFARDARGNSSSCSLTVKVLSETEMVDVLVVHVEALLDSGTVNPGQANSMQRKLDTIVAAIEDGRYTTACDQLAALQGQIQSWLDSGVLTEEEALPSQTSASNLQATLGCSAG